MTGTVTLCLPSLWQSMGLLRRIDVIVLALMLARVIAIVGWVAYQYQSTRRSFLTDPNSQELHSDRKMFAADLSLRLYTLRSIAHTAPFLGLAGSCIGISTPSQESECKEGPRWRS